LQQLLDALQVKLALRSIANSYSKYMWALRYLASSQLNILASKTKYSCSYIASQQACAGLPTRF